MKHSTKSRRSPHPNPWKIGLIIAACVAIVLVAYGAYRAIDTAITNDRIMKGENMVVPVRIKPGDTLEMSNEVEEKRDVDIVYGGEYLFEYSFEGTLEARVDRPARLYNNPRDAGLGDLESFDQDTQDVLIAYLTLKNVDAVPDTDVRLNIPTFNITFFNVCGDDYPPFENGMEAHLADGTVLFDGSIDPDGPFNFYKFTLDPGEERTFEMVYTVPKGPKPQYFKIGSGNTIPYYLEFDLEDHTS